MRNPYRGRVVGGKWRYDTDRVKHKWTEEQLKMLNTPYSHAELSQILNLPRGLIASKRSALKIKYLELRQNKAWEQKQ